MVDLQGTHGAITASDFIFKVGNNNTPSTWTAAPAPASVVVRPGAGVSGSDRIELIWGADAVKNLWLEVIVKGNDATGGNNTNTGLATSNVFFFGSRVADSGSGTGVTAVTNLTDETAARNNAGLGVVDHQPVRLRPQRFGAGWRLDCLAEQRRFHHQDQPDESARGSGSGSAGGQRFGARATRSRPA